MNEEQLEASMEDWKKRKAIRNRADGYRTGRIEESRKQRIKRLRRWEDVSDRYPDRRLNVDCVWKNKSNPFDLMITKMPHPERVVSNRYPEFQFNGYCRFRHKPVIEEGYNGILNYVPVHGGITYCHHSKGVSTYGFDTAHSDDENNPLCRNIEWIEFQCRLMSESIRIASRFEPEYLKHKDRLVRAYVVDKFHRAILKKTGQNFNLTNNFGAMINLLCGDV